MCQGAYRKDRLILFSSPSVNPGGLQLLKGGIMGTDVAKGIIFQCPNCGKEVVEVTYRNAVYYYCTECAWDKLVDLSDVKVNDV